MRSSLGVLTLLLSACLFLSVSGAGSYVAPQVPSVAWVKIRPTINGMPMDSESNPGPSPRCDHSFTILPEAFARLLRQDVQIGGNGIGPQSVDDDEPTFLFMQGGLGYNGEVLSDSWLLEVSSTRTHSNANWLSLTPGEGEGVMPARHGFSLEWLPSAQRLIAFGGEDSDAYYDDAWEYIFNPAGEFHPGWTQISLNNSGISSSPLARSSMGGWIRLPNPSVEVRDSLLMFGGATSNHSTNSGRRGLADLWKLQVEIPTDGDLTSTSARGEWSQPESVECHSTQTYCPDAKSFASLFPELVTYTTGLTSLSHSGGLRPESVRETLDALADYSTNLTSILSSPDYIEWSLSHTATDGPCVEQCISSTVTNASPSRPSSREGHRVSLWDWTNPTTGEHISKLVLFGGYSCPEGGPITSSCFDPNVHFLDLYTFEWSVLERPTQPPSTPKDAWPLRRAFHTQHLYTTTTSAQLWIIGGTFIDMASTLTFKNDVAVLDLLTNTWSLANSDLTDPTRLDEFGNHYSSYKHVASARMGSFLTSNQLWLHGGCHSDSSGILEPNGVDEHEGTLWVLKLGQYLKAEELRIVNDSPEWIFGQGVTKALPGGGRANYFFIETAANIGYQVNWEEDSTDAEINNALAEAGTLPKTNSTPVPYWGENFQWSAGIQSRFKIQMVSTRVRTDDSGGSVGDELLIVDGTPYDTLADDVFLVEFALYSGNQYEVYISYDGIDVPGSPYHLKLETGEVSPILTYPTGPSVAIPPVTYVEGSDGRMMIEQQHYGSDYMVPTPFAGAGLGLQQGLRKSTASFLLQIVDVYENNWIDNTNALIYLTDSIYSGVPFDAINLTISMTSPDGQRSELRLGDQFQYVNNEVGTYTVTYRVPDLSYYTLNISINGEPIDHEAKYDVIGIDPLELSEGQAAGIIAITVIVTALILSSFIFFFLKRSTVVMKSRSLLFDGLFLIGTIFGLFAILDQTHYSGGIRKDLDDTVHNGTHNPCQMYSVLIGQATLFCFGALYAMVRRSHLIFKRVRQSASTRDSDKKMIILNQDLPNCSPEAPLPTIPGVHPDWHILRPVIGCIIVELIFQTLWIGINPLHPHMKVASDDFRSYEFCDGDNRDAWVWCSIGLKGVMCAVMMYAISNGRNIGDPIAETKFVAWSGYNMSFTSIVVIILVFFLDSQDSIKTSFIVSSVAVFWSCLLMFALVYAPRIRQIVRAKNHDQFWYDNWIITVQEDELLQRATDEKAARDAKNAGNGLSSLGHSSLGGGNVSSLGANASSLGSSSSSAGGPSPLTRGTSSGNIRNLKDSSSRPAGASIAPKPVAVVNRAMPATRAQAVARTTVVQQPTTITTPLADSSVVSDAITDEHL